LERPDDSNVLQISATVAQRQGDGVRAIQLLTRATQAGDDPQPLLGLGQLLQDSGKEDEALQCYLRAIQINPDLFEPRMAVAFLFYRKRDFGRAEEQFRAALRIRPESTEAENWLIYLLHIESRFADLVAQQKEMQASRPNDGRRIRLALLIPSFYDSVEQLHEERVRFSRDMHELLDGPPLLVADPAREIGITTFNFAYHGENDLALQRLTMQVCRRAYRPRFHAPIARCPQGRIRIGFFSENLSSHSIGRLNKGLIAGLSRARFEIWVFTFARHVDPIAQQVRATAEHCVTFEGESLQQIESVIAAQDLDVLFYPDIGMDPLSYFLAFSRLAPVQCVTWGHPVTTGIDTIDYFISADAIEPDDAASHYSEQLVRLPSFFLPAYDRPQPPGSLQSRARFGLRDEAHLYICPQSLFKLHPEFDQALAEILRRDPAGEVLLIDGANSVLATMLRRRFQRAFGDVEERVRFMPRMPWVDCLNLMAVSDVMLDTFHFGGGNTSYEGLAMGIPVVTLPSAYLRGRFTLGCYQHMGMDECIATSAAEYVDIAVELALQPDFRKQVRAKIEERSDMLFGCDTAVRAFERFCCEAVART
jgi:predicted O-linked N-acetylglucosamine transferase (SPINDLY family)